MRNWILSDEGEKWSVKLDVRDLGGHLDSTQRQCASTLAGQVVIVLSRVMFFLWTSRRSFAFCPQCSCMLHYTVLKHLWLLKAVLPN